MNYGTFSFQFAENGRVHHINMGLDTSVEQSGEQQDSSFRTEQVVRFLKGPQKVRARALQYSGSVRTFNSHRLHRLVKAWGRVDGASQMFHGVMDVYANRSQDEPDEYWYIREPPPALKRIPRWTRATAIFYRGDDFEEFLEIVPPGYSPDTAEETRADEGEEVSYENKICKVHVVVDQLLFAELRKRNSWSVEKARAEIAKMIAEHEGIVNNFLLGLHLDPVRRFRMLFATHSIIELETAMPEQLRDSNHQLEPEELVTNFAQADSWSDSCISLLYTFRPRYVTNGMSHIAGVCHQGAMDSEGTQRFNNTGMVNFRRLFSQPAYAKILIPHEIAHLLGAIHPEQKCMPERKQYLMSTVDKSPDREVLVSQCTVAAIRAVLLKRMKLRKGLTQDQFNNCFDSD